MPFSFTSEQKQTFLWLGCGVLLVALLVLLGPVLTPFVAALMLAYVLNPGVDWIAARRIGKVSVPRSLAVVIMILLLFAAVLALFLIVIPVMQKEIPLLQAKIPAFFARLNESLTPLLKKFGVNVRLDAAGVEQMLTEHMASSGKEIWSAVLASAKVGGLAVLGWIATVVLIPVVLFYLLLDWHMLLPKIRNSMPRRWVNKVVDLAEEVDALLAQYLRGQLLVMLALCFYYSITLAIAGLDVALPIGIITGLLVVIPYLGFGLGLILALIAALLQFDGMQGLIIVGSIYGIGQIIEGFFLTPRLVGERIGLHPLAVIFALLAFGQLFGFVGVLLALPASAVVSVGLKHLRTHYLNSSFYNQA
ncbi:AI-2E family transporter [soil metagenome]